MRTPSLLRRVAVAVTLSLTPIAAVAGTAQPAGAVIGGNSAGYLRGQVQIFVNDSYKCTGTLIASNWVLTAKHCFDRTGGNVNNSLVAAGERGFARGHLMAIAGIYKEPFQDAMLLNLWQDVPNWSRIAVGYSAAYPPINSTPSISGWGSTTRGSYTQPSTLQICGMRVTDYGIHHDIVGAGNSAMRLESYGSGVTASGDSGAGIYWLDKIYGIHIADNESNLAYGLTTHFIAGWIEAVSGVGPS
ncbi:trypsin-like serine protease [Micromonospora antibiotica]|uniref:Trypsin-like serine protease n=1 Tax=Micromonospora antibiotica TaxID=2807623 RepID=A0ABS3VHQ2_9ACTN|nr:trypsin-like serine protease [Micromonospora antibiotica]MBO4165155.1 trypsin-like serine protease [Micromonospora antibiotica]